MYEQLNIEVEKTMMTTTTSTTATTTATSTTANPDGASTDGSDDRTSGGGGSGDNGGEFLSLEQKIPSLLNLSHNSVLNCLFLLTADKKLILYDCNSRTRIREIDWNESLPESKHLLVFIVVEVKLSSKLKQTKKKIDQWPNFFQLNSIEFN